MDFRVTGPLFKTPVAVTEESGDKLPAGRRVYCLHVISKSRNENRENSEEPPFRG